MKYEPPVDRAALLAALREEYSLAVDELVFVPEGYAAACYVARHQGEDRYFLKLWPDTDAGRRGAAQRGVTLPLLRALSTRKLGIPVPEPLENRDGGLWSISVGAPFAVFSFIAGRMPPPFADWPDSWHDQLAHHMVAAQRATPLLTDISLTRERFDVACESELVRNLAAIERIGPTARPGLRRLRELILAHRQDIARQLERLHRLQDSTRRYAGPYVLCHTDIHTENLLLDAQETLWILDWDDALLAPPEHDVQAAINLGFDTFLAAYVAVGGSGPLQLDQFAFYLLRRYLDDMAARLQRILMESATAEEDEDALFGIQAYTFDQWACLDDTLASIAISLENQ